MLSLARLLTRPKREEQNLREVFPLKTGWDLGLFVAVLAPGQISPWATKYKETTRD